MDEEKVITSVEEIEENVPAEEPAEVEIEKVEAEDEANEVEVEVEAEVKDEAEDEVSEEFADEEQASTNDLETAGVGTQKDELAEGELPDAVNDEPALTSPFVENYLPDVRNEEQGEDRNFEDSKCKIQELFHISSDTSTILSYLFLI